ncbi:hypothetical protein [Spirosoma utsteinense]|uniref:Uncharacterized protein n=1 Tax=Spirosoma utsteinense TaxID=2585773 RepID=A0ABR6WCQ4_9BACT|nr:hypothetical protein [Spirosoma utsteinense]MBC3788396.1 hypothetical protein [Spirosoma utsteinense]MBC3794340.1 hypothetical protein [Spirosoma utsteinense]
MAFDINSVLVTGVVLWFLKLMLETFAKYWIQEGIVKPATNSIISFWRRLRLFKKMSDKQIVMLYFFVMALIFTTATLQLSEGNEHDLLNRLAILLSTVATCVSVVLLGLVYANIKAR